MAMANRELTTAEMAYAAIGEVSVLRVFQPWKDGCLVQLNIDGWYHASFALLVLLGFFFNYSLIPNFYINVTVELYA